MIVTVENLYKYYGDFKALDDLNLKVEEGALFGFIGPNGAGKTTTLKILSCLTKPSSGSVVIDGIDILKSPEKAKEIIGYMPDFFGVYDNLKVSEYMAFFASIYGISSTKSASIIQRLLSLVQLEDRMGQYVDELSRGTKQKLCLARCLIHDPKLLILDEPASGLDPAARVEMKQILKKLQSEGKTIIISSHILHELAEICSDIGVIQDGHMILNNTAEEIMELTLSAKPLIINVYDQCEQAAALIAQHDYVEHLSYRGNEIRVNFNGTDYEAALIIKDIVNNGILVTGFSREPNNLEALFMQITAKKES